jgi:hypothetical protein
MYNKPVINYPPTLSTPTNLQDFAFGIFRYIKLTVAKWTLPQKPFIQSATASYFHAIPSQSYNITAIK